MPEDSAKNARIAKNTLILYSRMLFLMLVSLYTSRIILKALGVEDYGIYNAVGGFIGLFAVISNSLTSAISRFITFELGRGDTEKLRKFFSTAIIIQVIIGGCIVLLAETGGIWFLNTQMNIPPDRITAANWVFQFSIITFVINLVSVPYSACIIAHEKMSAFAYISIFEAVGKLTITFMVSYSSLDKLIFYAALMCAVAIGVRWIYAWYCKRTFEECRFKILFERPLMKEIFGFAGWNFIGASSGVLRDQGVNVLLNIFCGPAVNAARGIAMQVSSAVSQFSSNFVVAINPQITKSFAAGQKEEAFALVFRGARFTVFLLLILSIPVLFETEYLLNLWLDLVPDYTVLFVQLILIYIMIEAVSYTMVTLMLATGNIRNYQLLVGGCQLLNFPIAYIFLKLGYSPEVTIYISIFVALGCLCLRLYMLHRMVLLPVFKFLHTVLFRVAIVTLLSAIVPIIIVRVMDDGWGRLLVLTASSIIATCTVILFVGCSSSERTLILSKAKAIKNRIKW